MSIQFEQWLKYPGSFVDRLKAHGISDPQIQVLHEAWEMPHPDECSRLNINEPALVREVLILSSKARWMFARSVFSKELIAEKKELGQLQTQSLGSVLFKDPAIKRSAFEFFTLIPGMWLFEKAHHYSPGTLNTRASIFTSHEKSLLLTEVFFPTIEALLCPSSS